MYNLPTTDNQKFTKSPRISRVNVSIVYQKPPVYLVIRLLRMPSFHQAPNIHRNEDSKVKILNPSFSVMDLSRDFEGKRLWASTLQQVD